VRPVAYLVGIVLVIAVASHQAFQPQRAGTPAFFLWIGVPTLALAIVGAIRARSEGVLREWFRPRTGDFSRGFLGAAILFGASFAFTKTLELPHIMWVARLYEQIGDAADLRQHVGAVVFTIIVIAAAEEVLWRGLVTSLLEEKVGSRRAWVWSAVLYAVAHVPTIWALKDPNAGLNPLVPMAALAAGLVWGFMARRFQRLFPAIVSHALFDWTVMMMFRLWGPSV
jgi:uncharacterized protein